MTIHPAIPPRPACYDKAVGLALQGGGALGSYQAGVYEAIADSPYLPDWIAGISIGAINAAIIAGNPPKDRVARLRQFWEEITAPTPLWPSPRTGVAEFDHGVGALRALMLGQPGFFTPRAATDWVFGDKPTSYYDTAPLRATLERLVDFDRINAKEVRFSVGAVNVHTGNFIYFDNHTRHIRVEHVMASGALPPGFPPVEIDGVLYWDGGLVSNTPLEYVLESQPRRSRLMFQVDVFSATGPRPRDLDMVAERETDIRYSSRTRAATTAFRTLHNVRRNLDILLTKLPAELRETPEAKFLYDFSCVARMDIAHLIYRPSTPQGRTKDFEFSQATMRERWRQGLADAGATLHASPWLAPMPPNVGVRTFDVTRPQTATA